MKYRGVSNAQTFAETFVCLPDRSLEFRMQVVPPLSTVAGSPYQPNAGFVVAAFLVSRLLQGASRGRLFGALDWVRKFRILVQISF